MRDWRCPQEVVLKVVVVVVGRMVVVVRPWLVRRLAAWCRAQCPPPSPLPTASSPIYPPPQPLPLSDRATDTWFARDFWNIGWVSETIAQNNRLN